ncbi:carotenoid oxygenase family protein [Parahaliea mediterranea]|uniref:carotenoid oxygenase family protein n=1 Tax=Parahaliea mediterranea TaxID=651086 RepID=UPI000E2E87A9|nr:carotenoid oxygenase family protein [Parahaliea mediterranea]
MARVLSQLTEPFSSGGNPYLEWHHAPLRQELEATDLEVIGEIPRDFSGVYFRNGPNVRHSPIGMYHYFDGDGMIHAVSIKDGKASYRNRWVRTDGLADEDAAGQALYPGLAADSRRELPHLSGSDGFLKDSSNTDVVFFNGQLVSTFYQCGDGYLLDPETLETSGRLDLDQLGIRSLSAHSMVDERTGELIFFDYAAKPPYMTYGVLNADGSLRHFTPIDLPGARLPHTLAITQQYTILMDLPLFWDPELLRKDIHKVTYYPDMPSRFGVIGRYDGGETIRWFECDPCYIYHIVNAWEEGDEIVMEGCKTNTPEPKGTLPGAFGNLLAWMKIDPTYHRWRFNLRTGQAREEPVFDVASEFPMINARYYGQKSDISYHVSFADADVQLFDGLVRFDMAKGSVQQYKFGPGRYGSEAPFAPRDNSSGEDDGYVVTLVNDTEAGRGEFQIYDARDIEQGPLARVIMPQRIPGGFHSCWAPGDLLAESVERWR